jgi:hypothetical protein
VVLAAAVVCVPAMARAHQRITAQTPVQDGSRFSNNCESVPSKFSVAPVVFAITVAVAMPLADEAVPASAAAGLDLVSLSPQSTVSPQALRAPPALLA